MADRSVEVRLLLDISNFQRNAARAGTIGSGLAAHLKGVDAGFVKVGGSSGQASSGIDRVDVSARRADQSINQLTGRIRLWTDLAAGIGSAALPIGAVAVPALTGLATAAAAGVAAGGSLLIAMQGIGDAVKAVDAHRLDPTVASLEKAEAALEQLGPHARKFVTAWQDFQPVLKGLRDAAGEGWFPGLVESLDNIEKLAPTAEMLLERVGKAGGQALAEGTASLTTDRWEPFLEFLGTELPTVTTQASRILGDLAHGAASMWMEFDPGNDRFLDWVEGVADGFDDWSTSAEGREDIREFLEYVEETGPKVEDFAVAVIDMFTQIAQAAAPLGGPVLEILTKVAEGFANIADSDIGTPIFAGLAALTALNRVLMVTQRLTGGQAAAGAAGGGLFAGITGGTQAAKASMGSFRKDMAAIGDSVVAFGSNADRTAAATERMRSRLASVAPTSERP